MDAVHPRATATVASPDIQAVDVESGLDCATTKAADDPEQVEDIDAWGCRSHQCYGYAIDDDPQENQP